MGRHDQVEPGAVEDDGTSTGSEDRAPRSARLLVGFLLAVLLTPGLIGFELWPMTAWRMFSLPRGETQNFWVLEGVSEDGSSREVDLGELPMAYSNAAWPLGEVDWDSLEESEEICQALVEAVVEVDPDIVELVISRDGRELVDAEAEWDETDFVRIAGDRVIITNERDIKHSCHPRAEAGPAETLRPLGPASTVEGGRR